MFIKTSKNQLVRIFSRLTWQLFLIWPGLVIFVYLCFLTHCPLISKITNEIIAPILLGLTVIVYLYRVYRYGNKLEIILLVLSIILLCREFHFAGTASGTYIGLVMIVIWCLIWRRSLAEIFIKSPAKSYLLVTLLTYLISQLCARRALDGIIPLCATNDIFKTGLEEVMENAAHFMFLLTGLKGFNR